MVRRNEMNTEAILAVMNITELVVEIKPEKKFKTSFEPITLSKGCLVNRATGTKLYFRQPVKINPRGLVFVSFAFLVVVYLFLLFFSLSVDNHFPFSFSSFVGHPCRLLNKMLITRYTTD